MRIHEILEGPHDPYTHKAIFFAGSPGAGKTYVARKLAGAFQGLKQVNMDNIFKFLMTKKNLSWKMPPEEEPEREKQRQRSKELVTKQQQRYTDGGLGLLIDSTGRIYSTIERIKNELEDKGYATTMVFVNTDLETALRRNKERERTLPDELVHKNYAVIEQNLGRFSRLFDNIHIIDNSASAQGELPDALERIEKDIRKFLRGGDTQIREVTGITEAEFEQLAEKQDACYHKVKSRYKVWPSAYASGALVQCRKKGAANWGNSKKK